MQARATVIVPVRNRAHFLEMYFEKGGLGGLFVEGELDVPLGEPLDVEVHFAEEVVMFRLRGQVRWRRAAPASKKSVPPGIGIELAADDDAHRLLLDFAHGKDVRVVERAGRRYGVSIPVKVAAGEGGARHDVTDDISEGGAFIKSERPLDVGSVVELKLRPPGALFGIDVAAVVAWKREHGRSGFGVEFIFDSARQKTRVQRLVEGLRGRVLKKVRVRGR